MTVSSSSSKRNKKAFSLLCQRHRSFSSRPSLFAARPPWPTSPSVLPPLPEHLASRRKRISAWQRALLRKEGLRDAAKIAEIFQNFKREPTSFDLPPPAIHKVKFPLSSESNKKNAVFSEASPSVTRSLPSLYAAGQARSREALITKKTLWALRPQRKPSKPHSKRSITTSAMLSLASKSRLTYHYLPTASRVFSTSHRLQMPFTLSSTSVLGNSPQKTPMTHNARRLLRQSAIAKAKPDKNSDTGSHDHIRKSWLQASLDPRPRIIATRSAEELKSQSKGRVLFDARSNAAGKPVDGGKRVPPRSSTSLSATTERPVYSEALQRALNLKGKSELKSLPASGNTVSSASGTVSNRPSNRSGPGSGGGFGSFFNHFPKPRPGSPWLPLRAVQNAANYAFNLFTDGPSPPTPPAPSTSTLPPRALISPYEKLRTRILSHSQRDKAVHQQLTMIFMGSKPPESSPFVRRGPAPPPDLKLHDDDSLLADPQAEDPKMAPTLVTPTPKPPQPHSPGKKELASLFSKIVGWARAGPEPIENKPLPPRLTSSSKPPAQLAHPAFTSKKRETKTEPSSVAVKQAENKNEEKSGPSAASASVPGPVPIIKPTIGKNTTPKTVTDSRPPPALPLLALNPEVEGRTWPLAKARRLQDAKPSEVAKLPPSLWNYRSPSFQVVLPRGQKDSFAVPSPVATHRHSESQKDEVDVGPSSNVAESPFRTQIFPRPYPADYEERAFKKPPAPWYVTSPAKEGTEEKGGNESVSLAENAPDKHQTDQVDPQDENSAKIEILRSLAKKLFSMTKLASDNESPRFRSPRYANLVLPPLIETLSSAHNRRLDTIASLPVFDSIVNQLRILDEKFQSAPQSSAVSFLWPPLWKDVRKLQALTWPSSFSSRNKGSMISRLSNPVNVRLPTDGFLHGVLAPPSIDISPIPRTESDPPIAQLAHGLDRILFNPAPYMLQDPHTKVYNFDPYLQTVPSVDNFDFERIVGFVPSSRHSDLHRIARETGRPFVGSTSSLTPLLSHMYFLISAGRLVDTSMLSRAFTNEPRNFTPAARMPAAITFNYDHGVYSTDSDKFEEDDHKENILMLLGTVLEHFLTNPINKFANLLKSTPNQSPRPEEQAYQYTLGSSLVMRSQLDCYDDRLPGTGVFDIKTRAAVAIRLDLENHAENSGYTIRTMTGAFESFEREHYDLMRSGLLKYSFQARIGAMDGIFIAYHNTAQIQGFQYLNLDDMDRRLFGSAGVGDNVFRMCVGLLEKTMEAIRQCYPRQSVKAIFDTSRRNTELRVWIEPVEWYEHTLAPITELEIKVQNYIDKHPVSRPSFGNPNWSLEYDISRKPPSPQTRENYEDAIRRGKAIGPPPADHSATSIPNPSMKEKPVVIKPFVPSRKRSLRSRRQLLAHLRELSIRGRRELKATADRGDPVTVWRDTSHTSREVDDKPQSPPRKPSFWSQLED